LPAVSRTTLSNAQLAVAREYGFASWAKMVHHVETVTVGGFALRPLIRPVELSPGRRWRLPDGTDAQADDVFAMFVAARDGDIGKVKQLVTRSVSFATVEYNYTPPIHFAVREGHRELAEFLLDHGADPAYRSYPFQEALLTFAEDRGHAELADLLRRRLSQRFVVAPERRRLSTPQPAAISEPSKRNWAVTWRSPAPATKRATRRFTTRRRMGICESFMRCLPPARTWTRCVETGTGQYTAR
jgi:hypothetical protein